ncbi:hypothetical protein MSG28_012829 [Choristoneura fumiferana]|uniref:Uncharacterized protein n=1 Tax=Choristoneura fumiferana TaxID=7141 RepID=A0ACC0JI34_CHOFU|nr:hypothetical protein MSG28_012829 [Choristoneura fumiferana]
MRRLGEKIEERADYILFHKGEVAGHRGVGFLIKQSLKKQIQEITGFSDRIAVLTINIPGYRKFWTIIQIYAPTEQANKMENKLFYDELTQTIMKYSHNHIILMGDFNAQVGAKLNKEEYVLGNFGQGKRSPNGELLVELLLEHNLTILNSIYKKNKNNKWTWISPDGRYKNEIDYIMTSDPKAFTDTSVISNLNFNTNHRMALNEMTKETSEEDRSTDVVAMYGRLEKQLTSAKTGSMREEKYILSDTTLQIIEKRKILLSHYPRKDNIKQVAELSKEIRKNIRKDRTTKRLQTLEIHIKKTGGVKKALKELRETSKDWIPKLSKKEKTTANRKDINEIATQFYQDLYSHPDKLQKQEQRKNLHESQYKEEPREPKQKDCPSYKVSPGYRASGTVARYWGDPSPSAVLRPMRGPSDPSPTDSNIDSGNPMRMLRKL